MMTGRVEIYSSFLKIMKSDIWLGQGYDNSIVMRNTTLGYLNAQNGILDVITQTGLIGLLLVLVSGDLSKVTRKSNTKFSEQR